MAEDYVTMDYGNWMLGKEKVYIIWEDIDMKNWVHRTYNTDMKGANIRTIGKMKYDVANILTKNSPWTPLIRLFQRQMEEQGILDLLLKTRSVESFNPPKIEPLELDQVYLIFCFLLAFFVFSFLTFILEWIWFGKMDFPKRTEFTKKAILCENCLRCRCKQD